MWPSTMARPDIFKAAHDVALHSYDPTDRHREAVLKITACLRGTMGLGPTYVRGSWLDLTTCVDAGFADKSITGDHSK